MADEDDPKEYRWETGYEKTWEEIREDKEGESPAVFTKISQIHEKSCKV